MRIYPNPSKPGECITVKFNSQVSSQYLIKIIDATGRTLLAKEGQAGKGSNFITLDPSRLPKGVYLVVLKGEDSSNVTKLVIEE